ncbi:MAG: cytochrome P450 [Pseudomonadales bacterium]|nr:cytochrome P450 [Pseudomonadales bacterium]
MSEAQNTGNYVGFHAKTGAESQANKDPYSIPLDEIDLIRPDIFHNDTHLGFFERLRKEDPVHFQSLEIEGMEKPFTFWNVTRYDDIRYVDDHHKIFSSDGSIVVDDQDADFPLPMFIAMDPPKHDLQRREVAPVVAPRNLVNFEPVIRERTASVLDSLPVGEKFNFVSEVSIELTTRMLATLFDFPFEDRAKLTRWSDVATAAEGVVETEDQRRAELIECLEYFTNLWNERVNREGGNDLISMLAHGESTKNMEPMEYLGNLILLIVGGNDTTRNSMTGGVHFLNQNPAEYAKLKANPDLIPKMVPEIIRYQTPLAYMRRTALEDTELRGKQIKKGDRVLMWYVSGNRDPEAFDQDPNQFIIDRHDARKHVSFGFGIHRCMGNRLGEMQLRILWEEMLKRFDRVEAVGDPVRVGSSFVKGYSELPVVLHRK